MSTNGILRRSRSEKVLAGVCGGIARWLGWDPVTVRVLYVLTTFFTAGLPGSIAYLILWVLVPEE